ncbi:hypothetical protein GLOIN_2v1640637, partial [Rhizophagus irregularis DAOM 181602=DAOM 197198]
NKIIRLKLITCSFGINIMFFIFTYNDIYILIIYIYYTFLVIFFRMFVCFLCDFYKKK